MERVIPTYWNHRVLLRKEQGEDTLYIVEVFYNSATHNIIGWTQKETVYGESLEELRSMITWMSDALERPVLDEETLLAEAERLREMGADVHEVGLEGTGEKVL